MEKSKDRVRPSLRESARHCPRCMYCGLQNPNSDLLCLAHSNRLQDGKGKGMKSLDIMGAILCSRCHDIVDGRINGFSRQMMQYIHSVAAASTRKWWLENNFIEQEEYDDIDGQD
jgi:hypothetical protein